MSFNRLFCVFTLTLITGTPALTSRGFVEDDFLEVAKFIDELLDLTIMVKSVSSKLFIQLVVFSHSLD